MSNSFYVLVLAGGSGERFWPLSRKATPKQLLRLFSSQSLLEETVHRLDGLVPLENIAKSSREQYCRRTGKAGHGSCDRTWGGNHCRTECCRDHGHTAGRSSNLRQGSIPARPEKRGKYRRT